MVSRPSVSHDWADETPEAKVRWFRALCMADRMQRLCELTDLALALNPALAEKKRAQPTARRVRVLSKT